jgi:hypothetical protein
MCQGRSLKNTSLEIGGLIYFGSMGRCSSDSVFSSRPLRSSPQSSQRKNLFGSDFLRRGNQTNLPPLCGSYFASRRRLVFHCGPLTPAPEWGPWHGVSRASRGNEKKSAVSVISACSVRDRPLSGICPFGSVAKKAFTALLFATGGAGLTE